VHGWDPQIEFTLVDLVAPESINEWSVSAAAALLAQIAQEQDVSARQRAA